MYMQVRIGINNVLAIVDIRAIRSFVVGWVAERIRLEVVATKCIVKCLNKLPIQV